MEAGDYIRATRGIHSSIPYEQPTNRQAVQERELRDTWLCVGSC